MAKVKEVVEKVIEAIDAKVKVELIVANKGLHTVFHKFGLTVFVDGVAKVDPEVANELKEIGQVK